jgi:hypothetical protein
MIQTIKNFFYKRKNKQKTAPVNSITFSLDDTDLPEITIAINNIDMISAELFGELLFNINSGKMQQSILDILLSLSKESQDNNLIIQKVLLTWSIYNKYEQKDIQDGPIIKPTSFTKNLINEE